jgi:hypothetical protein
MLVKGSNMDGEYKEPKDDAEEESSLTDTHDIEARIVYANFNEGHDVGGVILESSLKRFLDDDEIVVAIPYEEIEKFKNGVELLTLENYCNNDKDCLAKWKKSWSGHISISIIINKKDI